MLSSSAHLQNNAGPIPSQTTSILRSHFNLFSELVEAEKEYLETLDILNSQIAVIWLKQTSTAAPDFTELLQYVHAMTKVNRRLLSIITNVDPLMPLSEFISIYVQWINEMEMPYANFSRSFIPNINQRQEIISNIAIHQLLQNLSANIGHSITLEVLLHAPLQRLREYKNFSQKLQMSTDPGRADYKQLLMATRRLDTILSVHVRSKDKPPASPLPRIQTSFSGQASAQESELIQFERQLDYTQVVDLYTGSPMNYLWQLATPNAKVILRNTFALLDDNNPNSTRVQLTLTQYELVICKVPSVLMFPVMRVEDIQVNAVRIEREASGEFLIQLTISGRKLLLMRADSREIRNIWVGAHPMAPSNATTTARPLGTAVRARMQAMDRAVGQEPTPKSASDKPLPSADKPSPMADRLTPDTERPSPSPVKRRIRQTDFFSICKDGEISPDSSDDEGAPPLPTHTAKTDELQTLQPRSVRMLSNLPAVETNTARIESMAIADPSQPKDDSSQVRMTFIQPAVAQMATISATEAPDLPRHMDALPNVPPKREPSPMRDPPRPLPVDEPRNTPPPQPAPSVERTMPPRRTASRGETLTRSSSRPADPAAHTRSFARDGAHPPPPMPDVSSPPSHHILQPAGGPWQSPPPMHNVSSPPSHHILQPAGGPWQSPPPMHNVSSPPSHHILQPAGGPGPWQSPPSRPAMRPSTSASTAHSHPFTSPPLTASQSAVTNHMPYGYPQPHNNHPMPSDPALSPPVLSDPLGSPIRQVMFSSNQCEVFHWKDETWYAVDGRCLLQVCQTVQNRSSVMVQIQSTGQLYLNAWILPSMTVTQTAESDVSLSVYMPNKETYLVHFSRPNDAVALVSILERRRTEAQRQAHEDQLQRSVTAASSRLPRSASHRVELEDAPVPSVEDGPQTLSPVLQCKCKLFSQNETSKWSNLGSVAMRISQQSPSKKFHIQIANDKNKLVSSIVRSGNVEKMGPKRLTFLLQNEQERMSMVYMIQVKDDKSRDAIYDYLKIKNAEYGW